MTRLGFMLTEPHDVVYVDVQPHDGGGVGDQGGIRPGVVGDFCNSPWMTFTAMVPCGRIASTGRCPVDPFRMRHADGDLDLHVNRRVLTERVCNT